MSSYEAEKEPSGSHKRKRDDGEGSEGNGMEGFVDLGGEAVEQGFSKEDDLLLEDLINSADGLASGGPDDIDTDFGVVFADGADTSGGSGADGYDDEAGQQLDEDATSRIDLMAREILEDSSQSQGTGYGPGRKKPRRQYAPPGGTEAVKESDDSGGSSDDEEDDDEAEVEVLEEDDDGDGDEGADGDNRIGGKGVHSRPKRGSVDDDDDDGDEDDEGEGDDGKEFRALGSKGLFTVRDGAGVGRTAAAKADDDSDSNDEGEEEGGDKEEDDDDDEDDGDNDDEEEGIEHTLTRAGMDQYLDLDAKISLLTRAVRRFDARSQVSTLLTSALLQLANTRPDFAAEVEKEIEHAKEEDYDSDDETEEKVEVDESETLEGWLDGAEGRDVDSLRASFLDELLEVPFKAKLNGERCTVVQAVEGDSLLVRQNGESFIASAKALTGAKGRNGAFLADWKQNGY